jgi:hypothetical protein
MSQVTASTALAPPSKPRGIISRGGRAIQLLQDFRVGRGIDRGAKLGGYFSNRQY